MANSSTELELLSALPQKWPGISTVLFVDRRSNSMQSANSICAVLVAVWRG